MNLGTIIIGIICIALCAMPFILTSVNKNKKNKQTLDKLKNLAKRNNSEISQYEICGYYAIGIDKSNKTVSFILKNEEDMEEQFINLNTIKSCELIHVKKPINNKEKELSQLYLKLNPVDKNRSPYNLEFFNTDINYQINNEIQSSEKWNALINDTIKEN